MLLSEAKGLYIITSRLLQCYRRKKKKGKAWESFKRGALGGFLVGRVLQEVAAFYEGQRQSGLRREPSGRGGRATLSDRGAQWVPLRWDRHVSV